MPGGAPAGGGGGSVHAVHAPAAPMRGPAMRGPTMLGPTMTAAAPALAEGQVQVYASFDAVVDLIRSKRDMVLLTEVETGLRLVRYSPGRIEFEPAPGARADLAARLGQRLQTWTGGRWGVSVVSDGGAPTIAEAQETALAGIRAEAAGNPLVQAILTAFPGATISEVRTPEALVAQAADASLPLAEPEADDDWNPFEE